MNKIKSIISIILFLAIATIIGLMFQKFNLFETNIVIVYILFVLLSSLCTPGYLYGILSSIGSTLAYNYFFTSPYFTFSVDDHGYIMTFIIMMITAIITSTLTSKIKEIALKAEEKELEMRTLYELTNYLTGATDIHEIAKIATEMISLSLSCKVGCLCFDKDGIPEHFFVQQMDDHQIHREVDDGLSIKQQLEKLKGKFYLGEQFNEWPIYGQDTILGVIRIPNEIAKPLKDSQLKLLETMIESIALAMDRLRQMQERQRSKEEMVQERYRANLLRSISHDLRTPLSGIMGTTEILMDMIKEREPEYELIKAIHMDTEWLHSVVENILNLTKIQEGKLSICKQHEAIEEIIESTLMYLSCRMADYHITIEIPDQMLLIPMDAKLIIQVFINLIDNAMKHTEHHNEITIQVINNLERKEAEISIIDTGKGIAIEDLPNIFQMFYTSHPNQTDINRGIGLGLSICEAIVRAHGGSIVAKNREDRQGAVFCFTLPLEESYNE